MPCGSDLFQWSTQMRQWRLTQDLHPDCDGSASNMSNIWVYCFNVSVQQHARVNLHYNFDSWGWSWTIQNFLQNKKNNLNQTKWISCPNIKTQLQNSTTGFSASFSCINSSIVPSVCGFQHISTSVDPVNQQNVKPITSKAVSSSSKEASETFYEHETCCTFFKIS